MIKPHRRLATVLCVALLSSGHMTVSVAAEGGATATGDIIALKDGRVIEAVEAVVLDADTTRLRYSQKTQFGTTATALPLAAVKSVTFAWGAQVQESALSAEVEPLRILWQLRGQSLTVPGSSVGDAGIALAEALLAQREPAALDEAEQVATQVSMSDWSPTRRSRAGEILLETRIARGQAAEVAAEVEPLLVSDDRSKRVSASYILALALERQLDDLVADNPRWQLDKDVAKIQGALYHRIFDLLLTPLLAEDAPPEASARSMWTMVHFLRRQGELDTAASAAKDILEIFPQTRYASMAQQFLEMHNQAEPTTPARS